MKKQLENQLIEARQETKKVLNELYTESKFEITIIWVLSIFAFGTVIAALFL